MVFTARYAFHALVGSLRPDIVCDVGSCDGQQALRFKRQRPHARVIAFEANPRNYERIVSDPRVSRAGIEVQNLAVADSVGEATFYVLEERHDLPWASGASSLSRRTVEEDHGLGQMPILVGLTSLDAALTGTQGEIALWIDVEGAAGRVVDGLRKIASRVSLLHIEVEVDELVNIWQGQTPGSEVVANLENLGFRVVGRSRDWPGQENVVLVRVDQDPRQRVLTFGACLAAQLYGTFRATLLRIRAALPCQRVARGDTVRSPKARRLS